jgi:DMSO/TMAO reductase YedYZ molybdopterin-dependent catalytic subunit
MTASIGLLVGVTAGILATSAMLLWAEAVGQPSASETLAEAIAGLTPVHIIGLLTTRLGSGAKELLFLSVLLGQVAMGCGLGIILDRRAARGLEVGAWTLGASAALGVVLLPVLGAGVLGSTARAGVGPTLASLLVAAVVFSASYFALIHYLRPTGIFALQDAVSRRAFLQRALLLVGGTVLSVAAFRWLADRLAPPEASGVSGEAQAARLAIQSAPSLEAALAQGVPGLSPEVTPNDKFYVVSKNVFHDPEVDVSSWRLEIAGAVDRPLSLSYPELKALPSIEQYLTLECISNEVGGELISNARWRGVPLADLLLRAGVRPAAVDVVLRSADDYSDSIPVEAAMASGTLLAYEMNGEVLPKVHGFPLRLLVPNIFGMKNAKWVNKIEVFEYDYQGYWQYRGWSDVATMLTTSRIDIPRNASRLLPGANYVGGVALAGARGIAKVEVSTDDGRTWQPAVLKPPLGPFTWVQWLLKWDLPADSTAPVRIMVRATDATGALQEATIRDMLPDGATGLHAITVTPTTPS